MASISNSLPLKHGISLWCPQHASLNRTRLPSSFGSSASARRYGVVSCAFANENREWVLWIFIYFKIFNLQLFLFAWLMREEWRISIWISWVELNSRFFSFSAFLETKKREDFRIWAALRALDMIFCRFVIVGGGNAAGYAARTFVEHGMADGKLCIVSKEVIHLGFLNYTENDLMNLHL